MHNKRQIKCQIFVNVWKIKAYESSNGSSCAEEMASKNLLANG